MVRPGMASPTHSHPIPGEESRLAGIGWGEGTLALGHQDKGGWRMTAVAWVG